MAKEKTSKFITKEQIDHNKKLYLPGDEIELSDTEAAALTGLISPVKTDDKKADEKKTDDKKTNEKES